MCWQILDALFVVTKPFLSRPWSISIDPSFERLASMCIIDTQKPSSAIWHIMFYYLLLFKRSRLPAGQLLDSKQEAFDT